MHSPGIWKPGNFSIHAAVVYCHITTHSHYSAQRSSSYLLCIQHAGITFCPQRNKEGSYCWIADRNGNKTSDRRLLIFDCRFESFYKDSPDTCPKSSLSKVSDIAWENELPVAEGCYFCCCSIVAGLTAFAKLVLSRRRQDNRWTFFIYWTLRIAGDSSLYFY